MLKIFLCSIFYVWENHWHSIDDWKYAIEKLKKEGKIQYAGFSTKRNQSNGYLESLNTGYFDFVLTVYNILEQSAEDEIFNFCKSKKIKIFAKSIFENGALLKSIEEFSFLDSNDYRSKHYNVIQLKELEKIKEKITHYLDNKMSIAEFCFRFVYFNPNIDSTLIGSSSINQLAQNMDYIKNGPLDTDILNFAKSLRIDRNYMFEKTNHLLLTQSMIEIKALVFKILFHFQSK